MVEETKSQKVSTEDIEEDNPLDELMCNYSDRARKSQSKREDRKILADFMADPATEPIRHRRSFLEMEILLHQKGRDATRVYLGLMGKDGLNIYRSYQRAFLFSLDVLEGDGPVPVQLQPVLSSPVLEQKADCYAQVTSAFGRSGSMPEDRQILKRLLKEETFPDLPDRNQFIKLIFKIAQVHHICQTVFLARLKRMRRPRVREDK